LNRPRSLQTVAAAMAAASRVALMFFLAAAAAADALATCGSSNCFLVTGSKEGVSPKGAVTLDLSYRYIVQSRKLDGTSGVGEVLAPRIDFDNEVIEPDHHREIRTQNTLVELDVAWGVTDRLTLAADLPLINDRDHEHFDEAGTPAEFFTKEDGASGFGDARLGGRYAFLVKSRDLLVGTLAVKLPTGQYKLNDSEGEINEPTIQPGSGSYDAIPGVYYARQIVPSRLEAFGSLSRKINSANDLDYRFGTETLAAAGVQYMAGARVSWSGQVNLRRTGHDLYRDHLVDSTGGTLVNLTPGIRVKSGDSSFYAFLQIPIHQDVNDAQLAPRTAVLVGVSRRM